MGHSPTIRQIDSPVDPQGQPGQAYLRLSLVDRCNFRCSYCRPEPEREPCQPGLADEQLLELVRRLDQVTPLAKVRLTGGEPLLHPRPVELVAGLRRRLPAARLCLTTNGTRLSRLALPLRQAGLDAINVSLDAADAQTFRRATGGGDLGRVLDGMAAARAAGIPRLKLNAVLMRSTGSAEQLTALVRLAHAQGYEPRFIELMPMGSASSLFRQEHLPADEALRRLGSELRHQGSLGRQGTARRHLFTDGEQQITVGLISPVSHPFCHGCDRLRLDSRGRLFPCLRSLRRLDLGALPDGEIPADVAQQIRAAVGGASGLERWPRRQMVAIGG